jgi:hypothetical protein
LRFKNWDRKFKNKKVGGMWGAGRPEWSKIRPDPATYPGVLRPAAVAATAGEFCPIPAANFTAGTDPNFKTKRADPPEKFARRCHAFFLRPRSAYFVFSSPPHFITLKY